MLTTFSRKRKANCKRMLILSAIIKFSRRFFCHDGGCMVVSIRLYIKSLKRQNISMATLKDNTRNDDVSNTREKAEILSKQYEGVS